MATNDVVITLRIDDAGNIKQVGNKAKKASKDVDKLGKSAASADRHMKGVSQQSSNASKNFSKMAQGMSGGLVPAYATLAAQIFAVTALFRFLQQAADFRVLIEGQKAFAAETGIAYNTIARSLQTATDGQLAFRDASQAAAIGSAAGVSPDQLERLAGAARNVSIALGRDLTDSFNRLIRGTTKAEPELLDELGIVLRLEEATKNYAAQIGKTANTLTIYEKSQAVTNEVLKQAEDKFGAIGDNAELQVNALNQFAKAFDDVTNKLYEFIGPIAEGLAKFFSNNLTAFIGALGIFAIPIIKMILPAFDEMGERALVTAEKHRMALNSQKEDLRSYQAQFAQSRDKTGFAKDAFTSQSKKMGLSTSGRGKANAIAHFERQTTQLIKGEITKRTGILASASTKEVALLKSKYAAMQGSASKFTLFFQRQMTTVTSSVAIASTKIKTIWSGTMAFMSRAASRAGKLINRAFSVLMIISVLVMLFDLVKPYLDKYLGTNFTKEEDPLMASVEGAKDLNKELGRMANRFKEKVGGEGSLADTLATANFGGNMVQSANLGARLTEYKGSTGEARKGLFEGLLNTVDSLGVVNVGFKDLAATMRMQGEVTDQTTARLLKMANGMMNAAAASNQLKTAQGELFKLNNSFLQSMGKLKYSGMIQQNRLIEEGAANLIGENMKEGAGLRRQGFANLNDEQKKRFFEIYGAGADSMGRGGAGGSLNTLSGVKSKAATDRQFFMDQSSLAATQTRAKTRADIEMNSIRRSGQSAQFAKKELQIKKNLADIELARLNIKIAEKVQAEGNVEQKAAATLAIEQERLNIEAIKEKNENIKDTMNHLSNLKVAAVDALETGMGNAIVGVLDGTKSMKEGFQDMAKAVLQAIAQIIAQMLAMKAIKALSLGFADGGVIPMANGGIRPKGYRSGGVVTEPTYLVGEGKYNEAVVPLPDGRAIPVVMKGGSNGGTANVTVNISGGGEMSSSLTADNGQQAASLAKGISAAVQEELFKQQRPGGILSPIGP